MTIEEVREMLATILIDFVIEGFAPVTWLCIYNV